MGPKWKTKTYKGRYRMGPNSEAGVTCDLKFVVLGISAPYLAFLHTSRKTADYLRSIDWIILLSRDLRCWSLRHSVQSW